MKTKLIPFDINKAKAGAKVITRNGYPVTIKGCNSNKIYPIRASIETKEDCFTYSFTAEGRFYSNEDESELDLFIEEELEETDDYNPYKATVESIADMIEIYSELQSIEELKDFYNNVRVKCQDAFDYGKVCMINLDEKPADNKPKFKKGDWVIDKQGRVQKITDVRKNIIKHIYEYSTISYSLGILSYSCFSENVKGMRLWTIQDAKDGDVLMSGEVIFIFNKIDGEWLHCYCSCHKDGSFIRDYDLMTAEYFNEVYPATKEQRDLLFQKMKEAGYEWNSDKKELRKIGKTKTRRMTNQELSWWLREHPEEHREMTYSDEDNYVSSDISYLKSEANIQVYEKIVIRKNGGEWQEPVIEIE